MSKPPITAKEHVTLEKEQLDAAPGDRVPVDLPPHARVESSAARRSRKISAVFGSLNQENGTRLTIEEINEATAKGWAGEI